MLEPTGGFSKPHPSPRGVQAYLSCSLPFLPHLRGFVHGCPLPPPPASQHRGTVLARVSGPEFQLVLVARFTLILCIARPTGLRHSFSSLPAGLLRGLLRAPLWRASPASQPWRAPRPRLARSFSRHCAPSARGGVAWWGASQIPHTGGRPPTSRGSVHAFFLPPPPAGHGALDRIF